jgi:uncharacterized protein (DUF58 family)
MNAMAQRPVGAKLLPIDWGAISPLRLSARAVAEGVLAGGHRSTRRGAGVEFGGQRPYVPGDDLRFLDRRSLLRHDKLMVREFETDTDRTLWLFLDASASMAFRGPTAPGAKLAYAALLGAALCRVALSGHDPVGLAWLGGAGGDLLAPGFGPATFERVVGALENARAGRELRDDPRGTGADVELLARRARRGSVVVVLSDLIDLPQGADEQLTALASAGRVLVVVQVLDPVEADLGFSGRVRLRAIEGRHEVVTDAEAVREAYQRQLDEHRQGWRRAVEADGGRLVGVVSRDDPVLAVREVLHAIAEARR